MKRKLSPSSSSISKAGVASFFYDIAKENVINLCDPEIDLCLICNTDVGSLNELDKDEHFKSCFTQRGTAAESCTIGDSQFTCILCDVNLSKRKLFARCLHVKRCAKDHKVSTKDLLQMIAPLPDDLGNDSDDSDDTEQVEMIETANETVIVPVGAPKNALSVLMASAKQQSKLTGFFNTTSVNSKVKHSTSLPVASSSTSSRNQSTSSYSGGQTKKSDKGQATNRSRAPPPAMEEAKRNAPQYKRIQVGNMRIPIIVDGFQFASSQLSDTYFLTHFHSDHYIGLTRDFSYGRIYCSVTTANLVRLRLKVASEYLIPLELECKYVVSVGGEEVEVTFIDANHCPGAVCILFRFTNGKSVFHTGDFRWAPDILRSSATCRLLASASQNYNLNHLTVYLDTTYCDVNYAFPPQVTAINAVVEAVRREAQIPGTLFAFGAYSIGKERVFMAAAEELGCSVYVDKARWRAMLCYDRWTVQEKGKLTTDPTKTNIWVVPLNQINFNQLSTLQKKRGVSCRRVVGFQPTGWTHGRGENSAGGDGVIHRKEKDNHVIYSVAYSEHSSFTELVDFIRTIKPFRVVPTVNCKPENVTQQLDLLKSASGVYEGASGRRASSSSNSNKNVASNKVANQSGDEQQAQKRRIEQVEIESDTYESEFF